MLDVGDVLYVKEPLGIVHFNKDCEWLEGIEGG